MLTTVTLGPKGPYMTIQGIVSKTIATVDTLKKNVGILKQSNQVPCLASAVFGVSGCGRVW